MIARTWTRSTSRPRAHRNLDAVNPKTPAPPPPHDESLCRQLGHPEGLHVDFMQRHEHGIRIRTYEVGVEDETRACGTGSAASAYVATQLWGLPYPVRVTVREGEMVVEETEDGLLISGLTGHLFGNIARPEATPATVAPG
jgi:diaminopimelate epimerase